MSDAETVGVYNARAGDYAKMTDRSGRIDPDLLIFMERLPEGGHVLDLGCGPGTASAVMATRGFVVTATDASAEMVALAARHAGVEARLATFEEIEGRDLYDGVWANFSLLHAPRDQMPGYLARLVTALKPGGKFHIGMKLGTGAQRDGIGRFYTYYSDEELSQLLKAAGLTIEDRSFGQDKGLDGTMAEWICVRARG